MKRYIWHIVSLAFLLYMGNSVWHLYSIYHPEACKGVGCLFPSPDYHARVQLLLYASLSSNARSSPGTKIARLSGINISEHFERYVEALVYEDTAGDTSPSNSPWALLQTASVTTYMTPISAAFQLMGSNKTSAKNETLSNGLPVTHFRTRLPLVVVSDPIPLDRKNLPPEVYPLLRVNAKEQYHPIFYFDELSCRTRDLIEILPDTETVNLTVELTQFSLGRLRLFVVAQQSMEQMKSFGFTEKDIDEVKGIFTDTNFYFLALTFMVAAVHLLLDFLAFKNDVSFWRNRKTLVGLSSRTVVWSCFSHAVIFVYLFDENTSKLVLIPAGIGVVIEAWKMLKAWKMRHRFEAKTASSDEVATESFDSQGMSYLAILLIPLCIGGALYSLLYVPHKSWYSWVIQSLANGVYAFGFLFMLPQLFINYKLKSVAHLPWRAFMYKAFNTFIDDMFAFIIRMPTTHRLACFRDDVVFVIYLYQRWLYPVDRTRVNEYGESFDKDDGKKKQ